MGALIGAAIMWAQPRALHVVHNHAGRSMVMRAPILHGVPLMAHTPKLPLLFLSLHEQAAKLRGVLQASIKVVGVANSRQMLVNPDGLDESCDWKEMLAAKVGNRGQG